MQWAQRSRECPLCFKPLKLQARPLAVDSRGSYFAEHQLGFQLAMCECKVFKLSTADVACSQLDREAQPQPICIWLLVFSRPR